MLQLMPSALAIRDEAELALGTQRVKYMKVEEFVHDDVSSSL